MRQIRRYITSFFSLFLLILAEPFFFPTPYSCPENSASRLKVVTSFSVLADFVREIGGEVCEITSLVGPNSDAHVYEPTPQDAKKLLTADIIFINGGGFEGWISRLLRATASKAPVITCTQGITLLSSPRASHQKDPHAWNSLENALIYINNIQEALTTLAPQHKAAFEENAYRFKEEIKKLNALAKNMVSEIPPQARKVITAHDAFQYFGKDHGIKFMAPMGVDTQSEPSAKVLVGLIKQIREEGVKALFFENITDPRLIEKIAQETTIKVGGELYSDALSDPQGPAPTYLKMMKHNIEQIMQAMR